MNARQKQAKKLLKELVNFLNKADKPARDVWGILTALRGPDSNTGASLKFLTTARIRAIIGLNKRVEANFADVNQVALTSDQMNERDGFLNREGHFAYHFSDARDAIKILFGYDILFETKEPK